MKRNFAIVLAVVISAVIFAALVYVVLVVARVAEPAETTVYGLTLRRLWATTAAALAMVGLVTGGLALIRPVSFRAASGPSGATMAMAAGLVAAANGGLNVAVANGGPGTGNGVVGGAAAFVLGLAAAATGWVAWTRGRRTALEPRQMT